MDVALDDDADDDDDDHGIDEQLKWHNRKKRRKYNKISNKMHKCLFCRFRGTSCVSASCRRPIKFPFKWKRKCKWNEFIIQWSAYHRYTHTYPYYIFLYICILIYSRSKWLAARGGSGRVEDWKCVHRENLNQNLKFVCECARLLIFFFVCGFLWLRMSDVTHDAQAHYETLMLSSEYINNKKWDRCRCLRAAVQHTCDKMQKRWNEMVEF